MKRNIKLAAVSYLNTKPFLFGLYASGLDKEIEVNLEIPSLCAQKLRTGEVDLGLIPVAAIPQIPNAQIISNYCIGTEGEVKTVCIYSHFPIEEVEAIYLDYHSRTSAALTRYLLKHHWKHNPKLLQASQGFEQKIEGRTAALIIGDRTIGLEDKYPYIYDLGSVWKAHTGLPFVFAAWVSNKPLPNDFIQEFNKALGQGIAYKDQVAQMFASSHKNFSVQDYYNKYISFELDAPKQKALDKFLGFLKVKKTQTASI